MNFIILFVFSDIRGVETGDFLWDTKDMRLSFQYIRPFLSKYNSVQYIKMKR